MAAFISDEHTWGYLTILLQKLGTISATTKFTQGSTSHQQLAVKKFQAKTVKYGYMKNTQK